MGRPTAKQISSRQSHWDDEVTVKLPALLSELLACPNCAASPPKTHGVYLFSDHGTPRYVGRTGRTERSIAANKGSLQEADDYYQLDGFVRCVDCTAVWGEHHICVQEWRHSVGLDLFPRLFADNEDWQLTLDAGSLDHPVAGANSKTRTRWRCVEHR